MPAWLRWTLGLGIAVSFVVVPYVHFRSYYVYNKRLREVVPGQVFRSGQLTVEGFTDVVQAYHIRTILNVQDDYPDPDIEQSYWNRSTIKESDLCRRLGVHYMHLSPDLVTRRELLEKRPAAIGRFLQIMDDPDTYPILIHCKAGLHRTGLLLAIYRMEYQGWSQEDAIHEMKAIGFGEFACDAANDYVEEYVLTYERRQRNR